MKKKLHWSTIKNISAYFGLWGRFSKKLLFGVVVVVIITAGIGTYILLNRQATTALLAGKKLDNSGHYAQARQKLESAPKILVQKSTKQQIATELARNQRLIDTQNKLAEVKRLLRENKPQEAQKILQSLPARSSQSSQVANLQKSITKQITPAAGTSSTGETSASTGSSSNNPGTSSSGTAGGGTGGGSSPATGPLTGLGVVSFTANASPATASTCNISGSLTFSTNGSGTVSTTWSLVSTKSTSQIDNPASFTFASAGNQSDSQRFSGTQGLEPGDSYQISVFIASTSNPNINVTAGPIAISSCAAPPALAAEQVTPFMTTITPGVPTVSQYQDSIFSNECSVQVTTPYSVNSSGTVEAIVMETSSSSIGYTYYDINGATAFNGPGSASDTSYFRLPHLPGGGHYTTIVKLVEVDSPNTVYGITAPISSSCD